MVYLFLKAGISGMLIAAISEIARRFPALGAWVASLPLISILAVLWLWRDTANTETIAQHLYATFWFVLPSLPMFLLMPYWLRHGASFGLAMLGGCVVTMLLYGLLLWLLPRFGIHL